MKEEYNSLMNFRNELNRDFRNLLYNEHNKGLSFIKHLQLLSGIFIGIISIINSSINTYEFNTGFLLFGIFMHVLVIILGALYVREIIDANHNGLQLLWDNYNDIIEKKDDLLKKYLNNRTGPITQQEYNNYKRELEGMGIVKNLISDKEELLKTRKLRLEGSTPLIYSKEIIVFPFILGILFMVVSFLHLDIKYELQVILISVISIIISFNDSFKHLTENVSKFINRI